MISPHTTTPYSPHLQYHLSGRLLLAAEIPFPSELLTEHMQAGYVAAKVGVIRENGKYQCSRCSNRNQQLFYTFPCSLCQKNCTYCRSCIMMGRVSECTELYSWTGPELHFSIPPQVMAWDGTLSDGQKTASDRVIAAVEQNEEVLVWAVCGAGKTEVLFKGIDTAISNGKRVCICTPRTDVVLELAPRIRQAFPNMDVAALYGGSEDRHLAAPLTVSTTHQLYRFANAFDTIIIDEVDAFPYSMDISLQQAVQKAKKQTSSTIYLTATPSRQMQNAYRKGKLQAVTIPARYHRKLIPVPTMKWSGNWQKQFQKKKIPLQIQSWVHDRIERNIPILLFFPSIKVMKACLPLFQNIEPHLLAVHSEDPERKEKVTLLRNREVPGLLTTTILERGVTIPRLDVAVIGAEHQVFSESALVQIAGRVGRSADHPTGNITFFHYGKSEEMVKAVWHIENMNREASKRGLLDV
ncbi:DEAD/DEAH box helicase [Peribacillus huizhouensis]|uniref:Competence protein ComFA n=1 Tax=Peribacillus huizhouensis TaxID=1501239 RepID=A0ABR6CNY7_9BACI|nr:DEAD/DEAH box helicase [Peribacillus huizhouensis]MBA9026719.1 competence protein ComFA [Peribacillus huizhouensis]